MLGFGQNSKKIFYFHCKFHVIAFSYANLEDILSFSIESRQFSQFSSAIPEFDWTAAIEEDHRCAQFKCHADNFRMDTEQINNILAIWHKSLNNLLVSMSRACDSGTSSWICLRD